MCFDSWKKKKNGKNLGKNLFNFHVDSEVNPYGQRPLNDDEFRADVVDTKKAAEKENDVPTSKYPSERSQVSQRFVYAPTMAMTSLKQFDKRDKLPRQKKSVSLSKEEKRQNKKEHLIQKLAENDEKMKIINKNKQS